MTDTSQPKPCTLLAGLRVERGIVADWRQLAPLHYRSHHAGAITGVIRMVWRATEKERGTRSAERGMDNNDTPVFPAPSPESPVPPLPSVLAPRSALRALRLPVLVAVIVYSRSPLSLAARNLATGGRYRVGGRAAIGQLVNRELRIISRVVVAPNWRGLGLGARLVRETLPLAGTPYVEALAAMGRMSAFFERAGMTAYPQMPAPQGERLRAAFEWAGIGRLARRSAASLAEALEALGGASLAAHLGGRVFEGPNNTRPAARLGSPEPSGAANEARRLLDREMARWARSYLAAKNHKLNEVTRERLLELVARHLDGAPVYYLWRNPNSMEDDQCSF